MRLINLAAVASQVLTGEKSMPVVVTLDIQSAEPQERNPIQSFLEHFGRENLGGSSYGQPRLGTNGQPIEDWFNHTVPAFMLFRTYLTSSGRRLTKCTSDYQSSTEHSSNVDFGNPPLGGADIPLYAPTNPAFGENNLRQWLIGTNHPY